MDGAGDEQPVGGGGGGSSSGPPEISLTGLISEIANDTTFQRRIETLRAKYAGLSADAYIEGDAQQGDYDAQDFRAMLTTSVNGDFELPEQTVKVEYLKTDQKLVIPYGLAMNPSFRNDAYYEVAVDDTLRDRYLKVAFSRYGDLKARLMSGAKMSVVAEFVDAVVHTYGPNDTNDFRVKWGAEATYTDNSGRIDSVESANLVYMQLSQALGFNYDLRDTGRLTFVDARASDTEWMTADACQISRLANKLNPFTQLSIAALNYRAVGESPIGAWVRAYGVSTGLVPLADSACQKEYKYVKSQPAKAVRNHINKYLDDTGHDLFPVCMNILAMFGLLHLNKDHTYRPADPNMQRICESYVKTLRTVMFEQKLDELNSHMESICRTAAHPFGLAQTYFCARVMYYHNALTPPLRIRIDVAPPPIQRFMIVRAAVNEWSALPVGNVLNGLYSDEIALIRAEVTKIENNPPSYSHLHRYYGIPTLTKPGSRQIDAVEALMPIVYGFAYTLHQLEDSSKDGLALALSLKNIERDKKAISFAYKNLWTKYIDTMDKVGLANFARDAITAGNLEGRLGTM